MRELADLQVDEYIRSEQPVIEHKIDEEMLLVEGQPFLSRLKKEALTELKQEVFNGG